MKNILVINGHPDPHSFNAALHKAYVNGAGRSNADVVALRIADLAFDPNLAHGYRQRIVLEPDLTAAIEKIQKADHLVWVFPMWWYGYPALMKGFIDRTFLPGITFQPVEGSPLPKKLLRGKSGRLIVTADTPRWYDWLVMRSPAINQFKRGTLEFCGVRPVKTTYFAPVKGARQEVRERWLREVSALGERLL